MLNIFEKRLMRMDKDYSMILVVIVAIVAIVAIALFVMVESQNADLAGDAARKRPGVLYADTGQLSTSSDTSTNTAGEAKKSAKL